MFFQDPLFVKSHPLRTLMFGILGVTTPSESFVSELVQAKSALIHRSSVQASDNRGDHGATRVGR